MLGRVLGNRFAYYNADFYSKTVVPNARVVTLFTTPLTIVPGQPGFFTFPTLFHIRKDGAAYTLNAATAIELRLTTGGSPFSQISAAALSTATPNTAIALAPATNTTTMIPQLVLDADAILGNGLNLSIATGNVSGAGGDLIVTVIYRILPVTMF